MTPVSSTHRRCPAVCREAVFGEFPRAPQSFHRDKRPGNEVLGVPANYCSARFYFYSVQSRDIHTGTQVYHICEKGLMVGRDCIRIILRITYYVLRIHQPWLPGCVYFISTSEVQSSQLLSNKCTRSNSKLDLCVCRRWQSSHSQNSRRHGPKAGFTDPNMIV